MPLPFIFRKANFPEPGGRKSRPDLLFKDIPLPICNGSTLLRHENTAKSSYAMSRRVPLQLMERRTEKDFIHAEA